MEFPAFLGIISTLVQLTLAVLVIFRNSDRQENRLFSLLLLLFMFWSMAELYLIFGGISATGLKLLFTPGILLGYFFCIFTAIYPELQSEAFIFKDRWRPALLFLPAALLLILLWSGRLITEFEGIEGGFTLSLGSFEFVLKGVIITYLFLSLTTLSNSRQKAETPTQIRRLRYTFTAMLLPVAAGSITIAMSRWFVGGGTIYSFGLFPVLGIIMGIILSYTMLKYNLMEIDLIFSTGLVYTLLTAILAGIMELMQELMQNILDFSDVWSKVIAILLIAAVFSPLKDSLISLVDRFFGRRSFDAARVMQTILAELRKQTDRTRLMERFVSELRLILDFDEARPVLIEDKSKEPLEFENLPTEINDIDTIIHHYAADNDSSYVQTARQLKSENFRHYFPFRNGEDFFGCLLLGPKSTKVPYTEAELNLVTGLANEIPHIIQNFQMIDRLLAQEKITRELELAATMLKAINARTGIGSFAGCKIASFAALAGEIKGDMLDICDNATNAFIGVYDAFHSGLQAVMTLNLLFSVFRTTTDPNLKLPNANDLLRHFADQKLCSAVTLLDFADNRVCIRNCGNPAPLLTGRNGTQKISDAQTKPIGLQDAISLSLTEILLEEGNMLLVYTNGLTKAFKELRGIELSDFLAGKAPGDVAECHRLITSELEPFTRKNYSDDITFIVVGLT